MKNWIWGAMFVAYLVIGMGLLIRAFCQFRKERMKGQPVGQERSR
jgi:hypothetical protein